MRVAVTARGLAVSSELDPRFGRASYFVVVDTDSDEFSVRENLVSVRAARGAGTWREWRRRRHKVSTWM